ncbi:transmembrane protein 14C-like [Styela clava]
MAVDWIGFLYAATVAAGGIVGYAKAGSTTSLGAGLLFGGLAGLGAYRTSKDPSDLWLTVGVSASLGAMMGWRFYGSRKFMPAGLVALLSAGILVRSICNLTTGNQGKVE